VVDKQYAHLQTRRTIVGNGGESVLGNTIGNTFMKEKIKYRGYCFKLNDITYERLKKIKLTTKLSWNITFKTLIDEYENIHGRIYDRKKSKPKGRGICSDNGTGGEIT
jgi:hypothetical protein